MVQITWQNQCLEEVAKFSVSSNFKFWFALVWVFQVWAYSVPWLKLISLEFNTHSTLHKHRRVRKIWNFLDRIVVIGVRHFDSLRCEWFWLLVSFPLCSTLTNACDSSLSGKFFQKSLCFGLQTILDRFENSGQFGLTILVWYLLLPIVFRFCSDLLLAFWTSLRTWIDQRSYWFEA